MHADLERLIALQRLDTTADAARRKLADEPEHEKLLATRLERLLVLGFVRELAPGGVRRGVEALERDQSFEVGVHRLLAKKKAPLGGA